MFIDHGTGIVVGETAVIGDDVSMLHRVTLGGSGVDNDQRHPKVSRERIRDNALPSKGSCLDNLSSPLASMIPKRLHIYIPRDACSPILAI